MSIIFVSFNLISQGQYAGSGNDIIEIEPPRSEAAIAKLESIIKEKNKIPEEVHVVLMNFSVVEYNT